MNWRQLNDYIASLRKAGFDTSRLTVQFYEKFSWPLIATIVVLLGAPFAFLVGTRGAISGLAVAVGISIVGIVLQWRLGVHADAPLKAFHETFGLLGAISALAVIAAWRMAPPAGSSSART